MTELRKRRRGTAIVETDKGILVTGGRSKNFITPGGGANRNESRMQAAIRELKEETGIEPYFAMALFRFRGRPNTKHNFQDHHTVYYIKAKGEPKARHEVKYVAYYKPGFDLRISKSTQAILKQYYEFKEKNKDLFAKIERLK